MRKPHNLAVITSLIVAFLFTGCTQTLKKLTNKEQTPSTIPEQPDRKSINHLAKTEFNRLADLELRQNTQSLRTIMLKLYKRNPKELQKTRFDTAEEMVSFVFDMAQHHGYSFKSLNYLTQKQAIFLAFEEHYEGDRILAFIVGLQTMMLKAHGETTDFYFTNEIDPQSVYNYARNLEVAAWKLNSAQKENGQLFLISNSMQDEGNNLTVEREFGKMIGRTDLFAITLSEESERTITRVIQSIASTIFLPI